MLEEFPRKQLHSIIRRYGQSLVEDARRCKGLLKDFAPKYQREINLLMIVLEHKLIGEILQKTQLPVSVKLDRIAQKLHDNVGIQKDFALWAIESWAIALDISPVTETFNQIIENTENEKLFELGERFYDNEEYEKAIHYYMLAAEKGFVEAQNILGEMFYYGTGVKENVEEAFNWFMSAAKQGVVSAQFNLGVMYINGWGIEKNEEETLKWWTLAAKQGDTDAIEQITNLVNEGSVEAEFNLGGIYYYGIGVEENEEKAFELWTLAANQGHYEAKKELSEIYYELGCEYESGEDVEQDITKAIKYFRLAAEYGHPAAQLVLAETLYHGLGMEEESIKWYQKAAAHQFDIGIDDVETALMQALEI